MDPNWYYPALAILIGFTLGGFLVWLISLALPMPKNTDPE